MTPPNSQPSSIDTAMNAAKEYLREQLGSRVPGSLLPVAEFSESPLEGEGRTWLFSFKFETGDATPNAMCPKADRDHFVAVGETKPNYFPAFGLSGDDAYSFHIGTRFMLEMGLQKVADELEPPDGRALLAQVLKSAAPDAQTESVTLAGLFRCDEGYFAVYRLLINGVPHYAMGCDSPPGFYQLTDFPPQTALRLHLGKLIRAEARQSE